MIALDVLVRVPVAAGEAIVAAAPDLHEPDAPLEQTAGGQALAAEVVGLRERGSSRRRRSASGDGARPFSRSFARTKASIGLRAPARAPGASAGTAGRLSSRSDHRSRPSSPPSVPGHSAPWSIHARRAATCWDANRSPFSGMTRSSSRPADRRTTRLSSAFPGTITGPLSPPLKAVGLRSSRSPPFCLLGPWHA